MTHLPLRRERAASLQAAPLHRRNAGLDVLEQMFAYFSYDDIEPVQQDDSTDYERAA